MDINEVVVRSLPVAKPNIGKVVTTVKNTGVVTILDHNLIERRVTALVHLGDKVVKVKKRRDRGLDYRTGLQQLIQDLAEEDVSAGRADVVWSLGE